MSGCTHLEQRLEPIDRRIELLEDRIKQLEARASRIDEVLDDLLSDHEDRIRDLEKAPPVSERLDAIDRIIDRMEARITDVAKYYSDMLGLQETSIDRITDRLCRLESRKENRRHINAAVLYRCNACDPNDSLPPCGCVLSANLGVPDGCIYGAGRPASWKRVDFDLDLGELILDSLMPGVPE